MNHKPSTLDINYFKIGSFVILGITLIIIAVIIFGSGKLFQKTVKIETYFDESVQGLSIGSPVKYLGFQIGYVKNISLISEKYKHSYPFNTKTYSRYIYVEIEITSPIFTKLSKQELSKIVEKSNKEGLRIKLSLQGLTGIAYLELLFVDPKTPTLPIDWKSENIYIPSTPSTIVQFSDNVLYVVNELKKIDFKKLFDNIDNLTKSSENVAQQTNDLLIKTNNKIVAIVNNFENISNNLRILSDQAKTFPSQTLFGKPPPKLNPNRL